MLSSFATLGEFDAVGREPFVVFMEPPAVDRRILNQLALFSLMSSPSAQLDEWLRRHPTLCRQVRVPATLKWEIRDHLDQANINERVLFPGLDGLSRWLARYYTPMPNMPPPGRTPEDTEANQSQRRRERKSQGRRKGAAIAVDDGPSRRRR
jgi:hypothetical protein